MRTMYKFGGLLMVVFVLGVSVGCDQPKQGSSSNSSGSSGKDTATEKKIETKITPVGKVNDGK